MAIRLIRRMVLVGAATVLWPATTGTPRPTIDAINREIAAIVACPRCATD